MRNWYLDEQLAKHHAADLVREAERERVLALNGLGLWDLLRRWVARKTRTGDVAEAAHPICATQRALAGGPHLVEPRSARAGCDEGNAAA